MSSESTINKLRDFAIQNGISKSGLACLAGIPDKTLANFWEDDWNPTIKTVRKIEAVIPKDFQPSTQEVNKCQEKRCSDCKGGC